MDVAAFEADGGLFGGLSCQAFALPALEPPNEDMLPAEPRLYRCERGKEQVVSLLHEAGEDEAPPALCAEPACQEGANSRIRLEFGEERRFELP